MSPRTIKKSIERIKQQLKEMGPMRPGSLSKQYTICGKAGCRCADKKNPRRHGPYYQLSYVHQGKSTTRFIRSPFVPELKKELANYKKFRHLTDEWVRLSLESSSIWLESRRKSES